MLLIIDSLYFVSIFHTSSQEILSESNKHLEYKSAIFETFDISIDSGIDPDKRNKLW